MFYFNPQKFKSEIKIIKKNVNLYELSYLKIQQENKDTVWNLRLKRVFQELKSNIKKEK